MAAMRYSDWVRARDAGAQANEAPQPFDNRPTRYRYLSHQGSYAAVIPVVNPAPPYGAGCYDYQIWPGAAAYSQPCAYYPLWQYHPSYYQAQPTTAATVPAQTAAPTSPTYYYPHPSGSYHYQYPSHTYYGATQPWIGRTAAEIQHDDLVTAHKEGAYEAKELQPKDAKPSDVFWVKDTNGDWHLRNYYTIENVLRPGRWQVAANGGYLVFIRSAD